MIKIGENTGDLEGMLDRSAGYFEEETEIATAQLMAMMEPAIIVVLAGVCGVIIGSVMAPMAKMYESLDNL
jgi:type IV pilus assembly protein PilC